MRKITLFIALWNICILCTAQLKVKGTDAGDAAGSLHVGYTGYPNIYMGSYVHPEYPSYNDGKWAIEVWGENFNIWKPWPSTNNGDGNYYLFINPQGGVGIGKAPTVSGIVLDIKGDVYSSGLKLTSDERLKTDIRSLAEKTDFLYKLNGKSYKKTLPKEGIEMPDKPFYKQQKTADLSQKESVYATEFGFLAQELKDIYPELVSQDTLGYYYVNYIGLIPILVEAVKEQKILIDNLATQLKVSLSPYKSPISTQQDNKSFSFTDALLYQNSPNPFSQSTQIKYYLPKEVNSALLCIYDINGKQLRQITLNERGENSLTLHGSELVAGIYLYGLIVDGQQVDVKRMVLTE